MVCTIAYSHHSILLFPQMCQNEWKKQVHTPCTCMNACSCVNTYVRLQCSLVLWVRLGKRLLPVIIKAHLNNCTSHWRLRLWAQMVQQNDSILLIAFSAQKPSINIFSTGIVYKATVIPCLLCCMQTVLKGVEPQSLPIQSRCMITPPTLSVTTSPSM